MIVRLFWKKINNCKIQHVLILFDIVKRGKTRLIRTPLGWKIWLVLWREVCEHAVVCDGHCNFINVLNKMQIK